MKKKERWVIKAGSQMVCEGGPLLIRTWMNQVLKLRDQNIDVIWVTSGAIAHASDKLKFKKTKRSLIEKQALSAIGQPLVMEEYNLALNANQMLGAQVLLTANDMKDPVPRKNLQNTLNQLLQMKVIPILNENDAVATEEIQFGDNDSLASQVAIMMKAKLLVILTDVDGLFDEDPKKNQKAKLIPYLPKVTSKDLNLVKGKTTSQLSQRGTGGMHSKLLAAQKAGLSKIITHLVRGDLPHNLTEIANGKTVGTQIGGNLVKQK
ncbi:MAG: glutamate 5-kinase [Deltaproteobacteria bacterium]|jgi:glutamate 5-kinase|nr:glutamate 5-kinase [Deltaproteobacteria bacterium]